MKARHEFQSDEEYQKYLKTYFAAMAMHGFLSNSPDWSDSHAAQTWVARASVLYADALLSALETTPS